MTTKYFEELTLPEQEIDVSAAEGDPYNLYVRWYDSPLSPYGYNIYGSYSLFFKNLLNTSPIIGTNVFAVTVLIEVDDLSPYFWVARVNYDGSETFLNQDGVSNKDQILNDFTHLTTSMYMYDLQEIKYMFEENRRRLFSMIDVGGEEWLLYHRMWSGEPCSCVTEDLGLDAEMRSSSRCPICYGTGYVGGFYPGIKIKGVFSSDMANIEQSQQGMALTFENTFDTLWEPKLKQYDILFRINTGDYFYIADSRPGEVFQGQVLLQKSKTKILQPDDFRKRISSQKILDNLKAVGTFGTARYDFDRFNWKFFF